MFREHSLIPVESLVGQAFGLLSSEHSSGNLYKEFIGAVIFIAISNPYNVGDRVRIGEATSIPIYVKRIKTYTTEFEDIYGKQVIRGNLLFLRDSVVF